MTSDELAYKSADPIKTRSPAEHSLIKVRPPCLLAFPSNFEGFKEFGHRQYAVRYLVFVMGCDPT